YLVFFFVQAEDGIRDFHVTGVQTCALPISIVNGRPEVMDLKQTLLVFIEHRREVVSRRTRFELSQAEAQRELVEGLGMAITEVRSEERREGKRVERGRSSVTREGQEVEETW